MRIQDEWVERYYKDLTYVIKTHMPPKNTKICLPITGGLDSRLLAGIVSKYRGVDISFCYYSANHHHHIWYAWEIASVLSIPYVNIFVPKSELSEAPWRINNYALRTFTEEYELYNYALVLAMSLDFLSGGHIGLWNVFNRKKVRAFERNYIETVRPRQVEHNWHYTKYFHQVCDTVWHEPFLKTCLTMPIKYRMDRWIQREALKVYHPELAAVPQDELRAPVDVSDLEYTLRRHWYIIRKHLTRDKECLNRGYARS